MSPARTGGVPSASLHQQMVLCLFIIRGTLCKGSPPGPCPAQAGRLPADRLRMSGRALLSPFQLK